MFTLLGATALLGVLSVPVARLFGEPYPWLSMPGFQGSGGFDGSRVRVLEPVFTFELDDGGARALSAPQLFAEVGGASLRKLASRFDPVPPEPPRLAHRVPAWLFPGFGSARRRLTAACRYRCAGGKNLRGSRWASSTAATGA